jgi:mycothiol synthase
MSAFNFKIRNYHSSDFDNYVRLHIETSRLDQSKHLISKQRLAEDLGHPSFHPEKDLFVAEHGAGIVGFVRVFLETGIRRALLEGTVHPLHRKKGVATALFHRGVARARVFGSRVVQICLPETHRAAKHMVSRLGLVFVRHFLEMRLDLSNIRLSDFKPSGYTIRSLGRGEVDQLTDIQNRAFADSWGFNPNSRDEIAYRINLSDCSPENIIMAYMGKKPIGYCWMRIIPEENPPVDSVKGEIHMLGVDPDFRKQGIGRNVLLAGLSLLKSKGVTIIELTTDAEDPSALALYESIGFKVYSRSVWYEKRLL